MDTRIAPAAPAPVPASAALDTHIPLYSFDTALLQSPLAQRAYRSGLFQAKSEAYRTARRLVRIGRPLLFAILLVSFVHVWYQVALIKPAGVAVLVLPDVLYHLSASLLIIAIDATALYIIACRGIGLYSGIRRAQRGVWFFFLLTALLNGVFVFSFTPNLPGFTVSVLQAMNFTIAVLLALLIPISILAVETAHQTAERTRLALLVEVATLRGLHHDADPPAPAASATPPIAPASGPTHPRDAIVTALALAPQKLTFAELCEQLPHYPRGPLSHQLSRLVADGTIQREGSRRSYRYFLER